MCIRLCRVSLGLRPAAVLKHLPPRQSADLQSCLILAPFMGPEFEKLRAAAGMPAAGVLGFLALLIALSQIGILLVVIWGGAAWWLFSNSSYGWAIFMIVWGLFVSCIDNCNSAFIGRLGCDNAHDAGVPWRVGRVHNIRLPRYVYWTETAGRVFRLATAAKADSRRNLDARQCAKLMLSTASHDLLSWIGELRYD
jgi:hypothetical protein